MRALRQEYEILLAGKPPRTAPAAAVPQNRATRTVEASRIPRIPASRQTKSYHCDALLCQQKDVLLSAYIAATDRQAEAVTELVHSKHNQVDFRKAMTEVERAKGASERARLALKEHAESHGC
jgi:hypothetical protein